MKRIYKAFLSFLFRVPVFVECLKTYIAEWFAILRKRGLYKNIKWTKEEKKAFNDFWKLHYGKRISNRWHRLYQSMNGVFRIDYIPEMLYTTKIEYKYNDYMHCKVLSDKSLLDVLFNERIDGVRVPNTYFANSNGLFLNTRRENISFENALDIISDLGFAVIKPIVDSSSGQNVRILNIHNGIDCISNESVESILLKYGKNYIVQEKIVPHSELSTIYPNSINTFRVISYVLDDQVYIAPVSLRIGSGGSTVDNIHAGGMVISVNNNGELNKYAYVLGYGDSNLLCESHPDTGVVFDGYKFSFVEDLIEVAKKLHGFVSNVGIISWDFTVDENKNFVILEVNLKGQSVWFPQVISAKSLFGENTAKFLDELNK